MTEPSDSAQGVVQSFNALQDSDKRAAVEQMKAANPNLIPSSNRDKLLLWKMLFALFSAIAVILAVGAVWCLLNDRETQASILVAPITAIVTGTLGLFAGSPMSSSE